MKIFNILKKIFAGLIIACLASSIIVMFYFAKDMTIEEEFIIPEGTKFIAHRGFSSKFYQNTREAFIGAGESDFFFGIETDIWFSADGKWVCAHDIDPFQDTSKMIDEITYEEAMSLPLNLDKAGEIDASGEYHLCDFASYLDICKQYKKMPIIELKCIPSYEELVELVNFVKTKIKVEHVQFISFKLENVDNLEKIDKNITVQALVSNTILKSLYLTKGYNMGLNYHLVDQDIIDSVHEKGKIINLYTINDIELINQYKEMGVDYITTDNEY